MPDVPERRISTRPFAPIGSCTRTSPGTRLDPVTTIRRCLSASAARLRPFKVLPPRAWVKVGGRGFCCMSRFDVFPGLQAEEAESSQAGTVPAEVAAGCGVVGQAGAVQDADDG